MGYIMEYIKKVFQSNVKFLRKKSGLSQAKFGEAIGVSQHLVSVYESGDKPNPTLETLIQLSKYANTSIEAILTLNLEDNIFNFGTRKPVADKYAYSHFEGMTYHVYYLSEGNSKEFYHGFIAMDDEYDQEHVFLHGSASTGHNYDCKMVIEGDHSFYIYGTEVMLSRRFHIGMYYPDFRDERKYLAGLGILTRIDSRKNITGVKIAVSSLELDIYDTMVKEKLTHYLSNDNHTNITVINRTIDDDFRSWIRASCIV